MLSIIERKKKNKSKYYSMRKIKKKFETRNEYIKLFLIYSCI